MIRTNHHLGRSLRGAQWALAVIGLLLGLHTSAFAAGTEGQVTAKPTRSSALYDYYLTGTATDMQPARPLKPVLVLMGGGLDVDEAYKAMISKAAVGGVKVNIVVIRATGADGYNDYLYNQIFKAPEVNPVQSVETLVLKSRAAADDPTANAIVARADMLYIAGGDQWDYINDWKGSRLDTTLKALQAANVPIGGTSAGLAILGDVDFSAQNGSITSAQALANPYDRRETLDYGFVTQLQGLTKTITDSHLVTRDRMGRLVSFLARMIQDNSWAADTVRGIGLDENTALVVDGGVATVVGGGTAYFLRPAQAATTIAAKKTLSINGVRVDRVKPGTATFNLLNWTRSDNLAPYALDVINGVLYPNGAASVY